MIRCYVLVIGEIPDFIDFSAFFSSDFSAFSFFWVLEYMVIPPVLEGAKRSWQRGIATAVHSTKTNPFARLWFEPALNFLGEKSFSKSWRRAQVVHHGPSNCWDGVRVPSPPTIQNYHHFLEFVHFFYYKFGRDAPCASVLVRIAGTHGVPLPNSY
jgi:hypothetical protein